MKKLLVIILPLIILKFEALQANVILEKNMESTIQIHSHESESAKFTSELSLKNLTVSYYISETYADPPKPAKMPILEFSYESSEELSSTFDDSGEDEKQEQEIKGTLWLMVPNIQEISWGSLRGFKEKSISDEEILSDGVSNVYYFWHRTEANFEVEIIDVEESRIRAKIVGKDTEYNDYSFEILAWFSIK